MRLIRKIIIHCSDSTFGDVPQIRSWHTMPPPRGRGWKDIGYHWVVLNGQITPKVSYQPGMDGVIQAGRPEAEIGAHCEGHNADSIGICLVGIREFTEHQMDALCTFLVVVLKKYGLKVTDVYGHHEFNPGKACPNLDMAEVRAELAARIANNPNAPKA